MRLSKSMTLPAVALSAMVLAGSAVAVEPEDRGPYYEDDAWYDISEWFDGNDYNPTDEALGRLDDETYDASEDVGDDFDNDLDDGVYDDEDSAYGYDDRYDDDNWFYDYYDDSYGYLNDDEDGGYEYFYSYYDYDGDGLYDASYFYYDTDNDGDFDSIYFYTYDAASDDSSGKRGAPSQKKKNKQASAQQGPQNAKRYHLQGEVARVKKASVGGTKNLVVAVKTRQGKQVTVDLGPAQEMEKLDLEQGDRLTAYGPLVKVGEKRFLLADSVKTGKKSEKIDRSQKTLEGTVQNTRTAKVRGNQHLLAVVQTNNKNRLVDLGPVGRLNLNVRKNDTITVKGAPVKVGDQRLLIAHKLTLDDETVEIDRRRQSNERSRSGS